MRATRDEHVERVALVGPPAVDALGEDFAVSIPVAGRPGFVTASRLELIADSSAHRPRANDDVRHDVKMQAVQFVDHRLGIGEHGLG